MTETCAEFAARWIRDFNYVKSDGTYRWDREHHRNLEYGLQSFVKKWGTSRLCDFPNGEALEWAGASPAYVRRAVRSMFNDARKAGLVDVNPFAGLGLEQSKGRRDIVALTEEELRTLADCAIVCGDFGPTMHALILWQGYVGIRPIATFNVKRRDFDALAGTVYLRKPGKGAKRRTVVVPTAACVAADGLSGAVGSAARDWSTGQHPHGPAESEWLFTSPRGCKLTTSSLRHHWNKVRTAFEERLDPARAQLLRDARADGGPIDFYELRHTAATILWERGVDTETIAWQLCNTREKIEALYGHPTDESRQERVRAAFA